MTKEEELRLLVDLCWTRLTSDQRKAVWRKFQAERVKRGCSVSTEATTGSEVPMSPERWEV